MNRVRKLLMAAAVTVLSPSPLFACAACYGRSDDPLAHGINWGILTLLCFVVLILSSIAAFFYVIIHRGAAAQAKPAAEENLSEARI